MKVFIALVLVFASVSARGSGPYLPSGWRPQGPAFYLPAEVAKPAPEPVQEVAFSETEASGSDALREYGPPKLEVVNINQGLPEVATEQAFVEVKNEEVVEAVSVEANTELAAIVEETATESQVAVEQVTELSYPTPTEGPQALVIAQVEETSEAGQLEQINEEAPTAVIVAEAVVPSEEVVVSLTQQELVQDAPVSEVVVTEGVNNIADAIVSLEKEVKAAEVQAIENVAEITTTQDVSGSLEQAPEGFLEYGPPGFTEYGPPKQEDLARIAVEVANVAAVENNEVRRRRFSPKFRSSKRH